MSAPADVRGMVFDKDGTLFDFAATWEAWAEAFLLRAAQQDRRLAAEVGQSIGFDLDQRRFARDSVVIAGTPGEVVEALLPYFSQYSRDGLLDMLNDEAAQAPQREAVPLKAFLDGLRTRGLRLGVATNDAEAPARAHLGKAGIIDRFDFIAGFDSGHGGKPAPGQLLAFVRATGLDPTQIVMVGDSLHDLHAGAAAGMRCIGVLTGLALREELEPFAEVVLPDIGHIPVWLDATAP